MTDTAAVTNADEALSRLMEGNARYRRDAPLNSNRNYARRSEVAVAQSPFAIVFGCADSRVPPEVIFDQGLGDLFVIRLAGNVPDELALGSMEYAIEHFHVPLVLVLGHERCGAVEATLEALQTDSIPQGFVGRIVEAIAPAAKRVRDEPGDALHNAVCANVVDVAASIGAQLAVLSDAQHAERTRIRGATYDLGDGSVTLI